MPDARRKGIYKSSKAHAYLLDALIYNLIYLLSTVQVFGDALIRIHQCDNNYKTGDRQVAYNSVTILCSVARVTPAYLTTFRGEKGCRFINAPGLSILLVEVV